MVKRVHNAVGRFFHVTVWRDYSRRSIFVRAGIHFIQLVMLVVKHFLDDDGLTRASALAYTTLISIVPLVAFSLAILRGLGAEEQLRTYLLDIDPTTVAVEDSIIYRITGGRMETAERLVGYIEEINFTALGLLGLVFLLWSVVNVLGIVEGTFNRIWGVARGRTWLRKFSDYTSVIIIAPLLLVTAIAVVTYFIQNPLPETAGFAAVPWSYIVRGVAWLAPLALVWTSFSVLYGFMPNTRVGFVSAVTGGIVGGTLWQLALWAFTTFNIGVTRYSVFYGSFAALPLFLIWMYFSWVVVIVGAEIAFAAGHLDSYRRAREDVLLSPSARERVALRVFLEIARSFQRARSAPNDEILSVRTAVPAKTARDIVVTLENAGLVSEVDQDASRAYKPEHDLDTITVRDVIVAVRDAGDSVEAPADDPLWTETARLHAEATSCLLHGDLDRSIKEIIGRVK